MNQRRENKWECGKIAFRLTEPLIVNPWRDRKAVLHSAPAVSKCALKTEL
jgi:hypothetical protein